VDIDADFLALAERILGFAGGRSLAQQFVNDIFDHA
jgi:hypothetical protein